MNLSRKLRPDEVITNQHHGAFPKLSRRRCDPMPGTSSQENLEPAISEPQPQQIPPENPPQDTWERPRIRPSTSHYSYSRHRRGEHQESEVPQEALDKLHSEIDELVVAEEQLLSEIEESTDPMIVYLRRVHEPHTIKIYNEKDYGYRILHEQRTEEERLEIAKSNFEVLNFVYKHLENGNLRMNRVDTHIMNKIDGFVNNYGVSAFRDGAFSIAINFDNFPPELSWRDSLNSTCLLRPVVIDGVAVQYVSSNERFRPFHYIPPRSGNMLHMPYSHHLNLSVKPIFDIIIGFLIRGHKPTVYLPVYYKNYVTLGGISKVDDVVAFRKLIELGFIEFPEIIWKRDDGKWFNAMTRIADEQNGVFVSSDDYRGKDRHKCEYKKPSERILTPCFLNTEDRLMVLQPTIRYRDKHDKFQSIESNEILYYDTTDANYDAPTRLRAQLYLPDQIRLICELCQLYPMKSLHKVSIKQLLMCVIRAGSDFEMPFMGLQEYYEMREQLHF
uniref:RNase_Zc3h12a_2 domain-containing protein n=1 Tax=Caenorhabditis japonica TaxID=281687 RepID=A0A8R1DQG6_CAEJA